MKEQQVERKLSAKELQDIEDQAYLNDFLAMHPADAPTDQEIRIGKYESVSFESLVEDFESKYPIDELMEIKEISKDLNELFTNAEDLASPEKIETNIKTYEIQNPPYVEVYKEKIARLKAIILSPEEQRKLDIMVGGKRALAQILDLADTQEKKDIYGRLANAVGTISGGVVVHDRYKFSK
ncbi:MAG: hypothetical protein AAB438_04185 [Patescibacteria group bacterium]